MKKLYPEEKLLMLSAKINPEIHDLLAAEQLLLQVFNWEKLVDQAISRSMGPLLYKLFLHKQLKEKVPSSAFKKLEAAYYTTLRRNMLLLNAWAEVAAALALVDVKVIALKGIYLAEHLYEDIGIRQLSDIDLLVQPENGEKTLEVLTQLGYQSTENPFSTELKPDKNFVHYPPMLRDGLSVEVHIRLHRPDSAYKLNTKAFIERSEPVIINGVSAYTLSFYDQLLFLCIHSEKHFTGSKIQFSCFSDLANFLFKYSQNMDWEKLIALSRENLCETIVFKQLLLTARFFDAPIPEIYRKKYIKTVNAAHEEVFIRFLRGYMFAGHHFENFSTNIAAIKGFRKKLNFLIGNLFPPKSYMVQRYHISDEKHYRIYYIYRFYIAISSILGKLKSNAKWVKER
jgi:hypothetical protein